MVVVLAGYQSRVVLYAVHQLTVPGSGLCRGETLLDLRHHLQNISKLERQVYHQS